MFQLHSTSGWSASQLHSSNLCLQHVYDCTVVFCQSCHCFVNHLFVHDHCLSDVTGWFSVVISSISVPACTTRSHLYFYSNSCWLLVVQSGCDHSLTCHSRGAESSFSSPSLQHCLVCNSWSVCCFRIFLKNMLINRIPPIIRKNCKFKYSNSNSRL